LQKRKKKKKARVQNKQTKIEKSFEKGIKEVRKRKKDYQRGKDRQRD
jgi:hypothetical protein